PDAGTGKRLAAYVVPGAPVTVSELRAFMEARVPPYMVPASWVFLERFPLLPSGKTDRRALPEPEAARPELEGEYAAPRTRAERVLAEVWSRVLGVDRVGVHDAFLELGGDSILGIRVAAQAYRAGLRISLKQLFDLRTVAEVAAAATPVERTERAASAGDGAGAGYPLSPMQQGILFHTLLSPGSAEYAEHAHASWRGPLDPAAFERAWETLAERHPVLRTTFLWEGVERPLQVVHPRGELAVEHHDLRGRDAAERRAELDAFLRSEDARVFDPSRLPLSRLATFRLDDAGFDFVWSFHDLVLDGWSAEAVLGEFRETYSALVAGTEPDLPERLPFAEYLAWLEAEPLEGARAFWKRAFAGFEAPAPLQGTPTPGAAPGEYRRAGTELPREATARLREAARRHGLTLYDLVQGGWAALLSRYAGERDVVFGAVVSGRSVDLPGADGVVGVLVNTLPVRVEVRPDAALPAWLAELQARQREAREHEHTPLAEVQRIAGVGAGTPLFDSILDFASHPEDRGGAWGARRWSMQKTGYPLFVVAQPGEALGLEITFQAAAHDEPSVRRMLGHLATLLEGMAGALAAPDAADVRVDALPWLTAPERGFLLEEWNRTAVEVPPGSFQELFEAQAARTPDAAAVVFRGARVSYAELNRRANRAARTLMAEGVGPETVVALLAERGVDFLVAVLGVLKAGGAYLPLDPGHPPHRHRQVLEGSRSPLALASGAFLPALEEAA
ncbi:MAG TPA: condensation domain-containing protein, partial [Longimicrobiaceae bacterium]